MDAGAILFSPILASDANAQNAWNFLQQALLALCWQALALSSTSRRSTTANSWLVLPGHFWRRRLPEAHFGQLQLNGKRPAKAHYLSLHEVSADPRSFPLRQSTMKALQEEGITYLRKNPKKSTPSDTQKKKKSRL